MKQQYDDTFLARWLANELSVNELKEFKKSKEYKEFLLIADTIDSAQVTPFDVDKSYQKTLEKRSKKQKRVIPLWSYGAAASILICVFIYSFFFATASYKTEFAQQTTFLLPDNSEVTLNAVSEVTYGKFRWNKNRSVNLQGEAYFKVEKGSAFQVKTSEGIVEVLGTEFTVKSRENVYSVHCYEGKVRVVTEQKDSIILTQGKSIYVRSGKLTQMVSTVETPSWIHKESSFRNTPVKEVIEEIERQYNLSILGKEKIKSSYFSGRFPHDDLKKALTIVFTTLNINYKIDTSGNVLILD